MGRPKSDVATIISTVLAAAALAFAVWSYLNPRQASDVPAIAVEPSATAPSPSSQPSGAPQRPAKPGEDDRGVGSQFTDLWNDIKTTASTLWDEFDSRFEEDRHDRSVWALLLAWLLIMGFAVVQVGSKYHNGIWIPITAAVYLWYYWPSLAWWGVTVAVLGTIPAGIACAILRHFSDILLSHVEPDELASPDDPSADLPTGDDLDAADPAEQTPKSGCGESGGSQRASSPDWA